MESLLACDKEVSPPFRVPGHSHAILSTLTSSQISSNFDHASDMDPPGRPAHLSARMRQSRTSRRRKSSSHALRRPTLPQGVDRLFAFRGISRRKLDECLQRAFEKRCGYQQSSKSKNEQERQVCLDGDEAPVLQQDRFEAVNGVGERIDDGEAAQPSGKLPNGRNGARGKKSSVLRTPNMARGQADRQRAPSSKTSSR